MLDKLLLLFLPDLQKSEHGAYIGSGAQGGVDILYYTMTSLVSSGAPGLAVYDSRIRAIKYIFMQRCKVNVTITVF